MRLALLLGVLATVSHAEVIVSTSHGQLRGYEIGTPVGKRAKVFKVSGSCIVPTNVSLVDVFDSFWRVDQIDALSSRFPSPLRP